MAEYILRKTHSGKYFIQSAGIIGGEPDGFVTSVMAELDCDLTHHQPRGIHDLEDSWFDVIITFSEGARDEIEENPLIDGEEILFWPMPDPTVQQGSREQKLGAYRAVRDEIAAALARRFTTT